MKFFAMTHPAYKQVTVFHSISFRQEVPSATSACICFLKLTFNWKMIALQKFVVGFCHTTT